MRNLVTLGKFGSLLVLSALAVACGDASDMGESAPKKAKTPKVSVLRFLPENIYSGFDGTHTFQAPAAVYESSDDLVVSAEDPTAVEVTATTLADAGKDKGKYYMLKVKRAGVHKLVAKSKGQEAALVVNATEYSAADWTLGEKRYETAGVTGDPPCTQCHREGGVDHSPAALAAVTDKSVSGVISNGTTIFGTPITIEGQPGHKWALNDDDRRILVTYLRALPPRGFQ